MPIPAELQEQIKQRFVNSIKKSFKPCPLIGPKWFRTSAKTMRFIGVGKLAKATGTRESFVAKILQANLDLKGLHAKAEVQPDFDILVTVAQVD